MSAVCVVDYGVGNLLSVQRALEKCGAEASFVETPEAISNAPRLILPGVGAFADGMAGLKDRNLVQALRDYARSSRPLLGICLGAQMLLSRSEEFGVHEGLGIIPGRVVPIPVPNGEGLRYKIPYIGWAALKMPVGIQDWTQTVLDPLSPGEAVYLLHSFMAVPENSRHRLADCDYDGVRVSAAIRSNNVYGCQFHPEKSGEVGLKVLRQFLTL